MTITWILALCSFIFFPNGCGSSLAECFCQRSRRNWPSSLWALQSKRMPFGIWNILSPRSRLTCMWLPKKNHEKTQALWGTPCLVVDAWVFCMREDQLYKPCLQICRNALTKNKPHVTCWWKRQAQHGYTDDSRHSVGICSEKLWESVLSTLLISMIFNMYNHGFLGILRETSHFPHVQVFQGLAEVPCRALPRKQAGQWPQIKRISGCFSTGWWWDPMKFEKILCVVVSHIFLNVHPWFGERIQFDYFSDEFKPPNEFLNCQKMLALHLPWDPNLATCFGEASALLWSDPLTGCWFYIGDYIT